jgi:hypothetical protein
MSRALFFSFMLPLLALAQSSLPPAGNNGGDDNPPDPTDAGAAGSQKGAFALSSGALAAIIIVVVVVVIGGSTLHLHETRLYVTNLPQLPLQLYGGSQRSVSGTFDNQFGVHHDASLAVATQTTSRTARIGRVAFVLIRLLPAGTRSQGKSMILRRVCRYQARFRRRQRQSRA